MANKRIFELIRKEEVVLFAGAGMSLYAGYPSGAALSKLLYDKIDEDLKKHLNPENSLPRLADNIFQLKGRNKNFLLETLKPVFKKKPTSTVTHDTIAEIPHFKTIITTNYDTLFEDAIPNIDIVRTSKDYGIVNPKNQLLFKIHSDFTNPERMILTETDYRLFFQEMSEKTIFWNAVKDRLASNHILFIGYSLEDNNILDMIEKIIRELGEHRKEIYFVVPSVDAIKEQFLKNNNIIHIASTGDDFIKQVNEDIKFNYLTDLPKGIGNADTAFNYARSKQLDIELSKNEKGLDIGKIKSLDSDTNFKFDLKVSFPSGEPSNEFIDFVNNKSFGEINLDSVALKELSFYMKEIRIRNEETVSKITLLRKPNFDFNINIVFDDFEVDNYPFKFTVIKPTEDEFHIQIIVNDFTLLLVLFEKDDFRNKFNMKVTASKNIKSTNSGLDFYQILTRITLNKKFTIYNKDGNKFFTSEQFPVFFKEDILDAKIMLEFFLNLKKIEKHFGVKFNNIDIREAYEPEINYILAYIDKTSIEKKFEKIIFNILNPEELEVFKQDNLPTDSIITKERLKLKITLFEKEFVLGYLKSIVEDIIIINKDDIKANLTTEVQIGSKNNTCKIMFSEDSYLETESKNLN